MANATLSLQSHGHKAEMTNAEKRATTMLGSNPGNGSLRQQVGMSNEIELNGEDFVILPVSGRNPSFNARTPQRGMRAAPGSTNVTAYKAEKHVENEVQSTFATSLFGALFPVGGILETIKHFVEVTHKMNEGNSKAIKVSEVQNINPKDVINPNKAFMPSTPFAIAQRPTMELWQQKRASAKELEQKKKKKAKGLGSF